MASTRAAELTAAYKTLSDPASRADYDDRLRAGAAASTPPVSHPPDVPTASVPDTSASESESTAAGTATEARAPAVARFEAERAGRDEIMRRAVLARLQAVLTQFVGDWDTPFVRGFDYACVPKARPSLFRRSVPPTVLVKLAAHVDGPLAAAAWRDAMKGRIAQKPIVLLLIGNTLAAPNELARSIDEQRRKFPAMADTLFPVPVDLRDWSAKIPANAPESVRTLLDRLKNFVS